MRTLVHNSSKRLSACALSLLCFHGLLAAAPSEFQISPSIDIGEDQGAATVTVSRSGDTNGFASVGFATRDGFDVNILIDIPFLESARAVVSAAEVGGDYVKTTGTLIFAPGDAIKTFQIPVLDNGIVDGTRAATVELSNPTGAVLGNPSNATLFIEDNEAPVLVDPGFRAPAGLSFVVAIQPDGRLLVSISPSGAPQSNLSGSIGCGLVRLNADGSSDPAFRVDCALGLNPQAIAIAPDRKILVLSKKLGVGDGTDELVLMRLNPDGSLDTTFHTWQREEFGTDPQHSVSVRPDGSILVFSGDISSLNADGTVDSHFRSPDVVYSPTVMALQSDGKFLIGGSAVDGGPMLARFNVDGSLDPQFRFSNPPTQEGNGIEMIFIRPDGKLMVAGYYEPTNGPARTLILRLESDGSIDPTFQLPASQGGTPWSGALLPDGKILMSFYYGFPVSPVYRFNADGSLDTSFPGTTAGVTILAVQPDGEVIGDYAETGLVRILAAPVDLREFTLSSNGDYSGPAAEFDSDHIVVAQTGRSLAVAVRRLGNTSDEATVDYVTRDGSAVAGVDYIRQSGTLRFAKFETVKQLVLPVIGNPNLKLEKTFSLVLSNASPGTLLGVQSEAVFTLVPPQVLEVSYTPSNAGGALHFTLTPAVPGVEYELEGSPDPTFSWNPLQNSQTKVASDLGSVEFEEAISGGQPQRFYRANRVR